MRKTLRIAARLTALVLAVLFILTTVLALPLFNVEVHLLNPAAYGRALVQQDVYQQFPELASEQIARLVDDCADDPESGLCPTHERAPAYLLPLSRRDYEFILAEMFPPDWLQAQVERVLDQFFSFLPPNGQRLSLVISTEELRERIVGEEGFDAALRAIQALPPCTQRQIYELDYADPHGTVFEQLSQVPACCPPEHKIAEYTHTIEDKLEEFADEFEDETDLIEFVNDLGDEAGHGTLIDDNPLDARTRQAISGIRWGLRLSPLVPPVLLVMITLLGVRSPRGLLRWWGLPLLLAGLLTVGLAIAALPALDGAIETHVAGEIPPYVTDAIGETGRGVVHAVARTFALWVGAEAGAIGLLGAAMLVASLFFRKGARSPDEERGG